MPRYLSIRCFGVCVRIKVKVTETGRPRAVGMHHGHAALVGCSIVDAHRARQDPSLDLAKRLNVGVRCRVAPIVARDGRTGRRRVQIPHHVAISVYTDDAAEGALFPRERQQFERGLAFERHQGLPSVQSERMPVGAV